MKIGNAIFEWNYLLVFVAMGTTAATAFLGYYVFGLCATLAYLTFFNFLLCMTIFAFWAVANIFVWLYT